MSGHKLTDIAVLPGLPVADRWQQRLGAPAASPRRDAEREALAHGLRNSGLSYRRIAEMLNVPYAQVSRWLGGLSPPPAAPSLGERCVADRAKIEPHLAPVARPPAPSPVAAAAAADAAEWAALRAERDGFAARLAGLAARIERLEASLATAQEQRLAAMAQEVRELRALVAAGLAEPRRRPSRAPAVAALAFWRARADRPG